MIKRIATALAISLLSTVAMAATPPAPKVATTFDATKVQCYADFKVSLNQAATQGFGILMMFYNEESKTGHTIIGKPSTGQVVEIETAVNQINGKQTITKTCATYVGQYIPLNFLAGDRPAQGPDAAPVAPLPPVAKPPMEEKEAPDASEKP